MAVVQLADIIQRRTLRRLQRNRKRKIPRPAHRATGGFCICPSSGKLPLRDSRSMFRFGKPETPAQWIGHLVLALVALFLIWWMFRAFVL